MSHTAHWAKHAGLTCEFINGQTVFTSPHGRGQKPFVWQFKNPEHAERFAMEKAMNAVRVKHGLTLGIDQTPKSYESMLQAIMPK